VWVSADNKDQAQLAGYTVVDLPTVIITHLTEVIKRHLHELLSREEVQKLLKRFAETSPKVVEELVPTLLSLGGVQKVLQNLLREQISIRDLLSILETLADYAPITRDPVLLTEYVRQSLARSITEQWLTAEGDIPALMLSYELETASRSHSAYRAWLLSGYRRNGATPHYRADAGRRDHAATAAGPSPGHKPVDTSARQAFDGAVCTTARGLVTQRYCGQCSYQKPWGGKGLRHARQAL
jgi:hypothetical protein